MFWWYYIMTQNIHLTTYLLISAFPLSIMKDCILFQAKLSLWHTQLILISIIFRLNSWFRIKWKILPSTWSWFCQWKIVCIKMSECVNMKFILTCWIQPFKHDSMKIINPFTLKCALKNLRTQRILLPNEFKVEVMLNSAQRFSLPRGTQTVEVQEDDNRGVVFKL